MRPHTPRTWRGQRPTTTDDQRTLPTDDDRHSGRRTPSDRPHGHDHDGHPSHEHTDDDRGPRWPGGPHQRLGGSGPTGRRDGASGFGRGFGAGLGAGFPGGPGGPRGDRSDEGRSGRGGPGGRGPGGHGGHGGRGPGGRGSRAGRGDIRGAVLLLLSEQPMHGYQLIQEITERSGGRWSPSPGAIYPALNLLEDEGLIVITADSGRKLASLTPEGVSHVEQHRADLVAPWDRVAGQAAHPARALREAMESLGGAAHQIARTGTQAQAAQALRTLEQARRELYLVLAGEDVHPVEDAGGEGTATSGSQG
jgi:DNA-binding PadR family transcriptional regulator